jgi:hypothetical protein
LPLALQDLDYGEEKGLAKLHNSESSGQTNWLNHEKTNYNSADATALHSLLKKLKCKFTNAK